MQAFNKIGFHGGGRRPATGLQEWMTTLDGAGIPFFFAVPDATGGLVEAQAVAKDSAVDHTVVFRSLAGPPEPDFRKAPDVAASEHWATHKALFPPELDRSVTWVETSRLSSVTPANADWVGNFGIALAQLALGEGFKLAAFGFAPDQPRIGVWGKPGMVRFLALCAQHRDRLGISSNELSLKVDDIWFMRGEKIGRFNFVFRAADAVNLPRPTVLITAFGWTRDRAPAAVDTAVDDITSAADLYAKFPEIRGAALWSLGTRNFLARQVAKLIQPVTQMTLGTQFSTAVAKDLTPTPMSPVLAAAAPTAQPNARFLSDLTIPDDTEIAFGQVFTKKWLVENNGDATWGDGYALVFTEGTQMNADAERPLPLTLPGAKAVIAIDFTTPDRPGSYFSDWRFRDPDGHLFGDIVFTRITAVPPAPVGISNSRFVADVSIPDDSVIAAGAPITKTWRVKNTGTRAWGPGFTLRFTGGTAMTAVTTQPLPATQPGQEVDISLDLAAPAVAGSYYGDWRMFDDQGEPFGQTVFLRIIVPAAAGSSITAPISQRDPLWADKRLGHAGSPKTIGEWGCLLTCFAMTANALGQSTNPSQLNDAMITRGGFLNLFLTKWNALQDVYSGIVYDGRYEPRPDMLQLIDHSLSAGRPVSVQVDFTRDTPYTDNDQHWVLIVGKDGDDYRINDPWLWPPQEASLKQRYGRTGQPLQDAIMAAIFYRSTTAVSPVTPPVTPPSVALLQTGMNVNPDAPNSNPVDDDTFKGMSWVRLVFKVAARINPAERGDLEAAFRQYEPIVRKYRSMGVRTLFVINQETVWGIAPWTGNNAWDAYGNELADMAGRIADRFRRFGSDVAYQIWNEGDKRNNPASVFVEPEQFARVLKPVAAAIRAKSPESPVIFNGMATGPEESVAYIKRCRTACGGTLPVDAIGIHPYTRWATRAPFDWGLQYGTLAQAFAVYKRELPGLKFWITEIGVAADNEIGSEHYAAIADYMLDVYQHVGERYADLVPVLIWFAWSDWMRNAGVVTKDGARKDFVYNVFRRVRNREIW